MKDLTGYGRRPELLFWIMLGLTGMSSMLCFINGKRKVTTIDSVKTEYVIVPLCIWAGIDLIFPLASLGSERQLEVTLKNRFWQGVAGVLVICGLVVSTVAVGLIANFIVGGGN